MLLSDEATRWLKRIELELEFAAAFTAALPATHTVGWAELIKTAASLVSSAVSGHEDIIDLVTQAEEILSPIGAAARGYKIHCVGHGHIDMNWMWSWPETVATTHDTFASVLQLMDQYPDLTYSQSQAAVYALVEDYFPDMFDRIRERVREGRWEITASHWVEGDKNLVSGESLCRHLLYTREYFESKFGLTAQDLPIDWEPDTFGHAATIPGILTQGGVKYYYSCRQGGGFDHYCVGEARPPLFYWRSPDGSQILVNRETTWYNSYVNIGDNVALPLASFVQETGLHHWLNVYGIGNHGGGPTRTEIDYLHELQTWPIYPTIEFSTAKSYFTQVESEIAAAGTVLPVVDGELNFEFTGCYTSQSAIKQANRFGENYLEEAETLTALANRISGTSVSKDKLREAWLQVLFSQFHDILPGSGVAETRAYAMAAFQNVGAITGSLKRIAGNALTAQIDTKSLLGPDTIPEQQTGTGYTAGAGLYGGQTGISQSGGSAGKFRPITVYNPCAWPRSERISVPMYDADFVADKIAVIDDDGVQRRALCIGNEEVWAHHKQQIDFDAMSVPALGYRTYLICERPTPPPTDLVQTLPNQWFETPFLKFRVNRHGSGLRELIDKRTGASLISEGSSLGEWLYVTERPRGMTAWILGEEVDAPIPVKTEVYQVVGPSFDQGRQTCTNQPISGLRIETLWTVPGTQSSGKTSIIVSTLESRIDFEVSLDWREIGDEKRGIPGLTVAFPLGLTDLKSRYEAPFGSVERSLFEGEEVPTLCYTHLSGEARTVHGEAVRAGFTLLQDCKYGHSIVGSELRMRIVRSSFDPDHAPEVGKSNLRYAIYLHEDTAPASELARLGAAFNHPLIPFATPLQTGSRPTTHSFVQVQTANVILSAFKMSEDSNGIVLRLVELDGRDTEAVVLIDPEITKGFNKVQLLDLMENPVEGSVSWDGRELRALIPKFSFATIRLCR